MDSFWWKLTARIAVFPDDECMAIARGDVETFGEQESKTGRVQICARAEHTLLGQSRQFPSDIGENIDCKNIFYEMIDGRPGLETTKMMVSGDHLTSWGTMPLKISTFLSIKLSRDSPSR